MSSALSTSINSTLSSSSMAHFLLTCLRTFAFRDGQSLSYKKTANSHWGIKLWSGFCFQRPGKRSFGFVSLKFGTTGPSHDVRLMFCDKKDYFFVSQKYTKPPGGIIHRSYSIWNRAWMLRHVKSVRKKQKRVYLKLSTSIPLPQTSKKSEFLTAPPPSSLANIINVWSLTLIYPSSLKDHASAFNICAKGFLLYFYKY